MALCSLSAVDVPEFLLALIALRTNAVGLFRNVAEFDEEVSHVALLTGDGLRNSHGVVARLE